MITVPSAVTWASQPFLPSEIRRWDALTDAGYLNQVQAAAFWIAGRVNEPEVGV
jgi:hypothetical protein